MNKHNMPLMPSPITQLSDVVDPASTSISPTLGSASKDVVPGLDADQDDLAPPSHDHGLPEIKKNDGVNDSFAVTPKIVKSGINVVAMRDGFYNRSRIREGEEFIVRSPADLGDWMKCLDPDIEKERVEWMKEKKAIK